MQLPLLEVVVMSTFAILFYRAGRREQSWPITWSVASIAGSVVALRYTKLGVAGVILAQFVLFMAIWMVRLWRDRRR